MRRSFHPFVEEASRDDVPHSFPKGLLGKRFTYLLARVSLSFGLPLQLLVNTEKVKEWCTQGLYFFARRSHTQRSSSVLSKRVVNIVFEGKPQVIGTRLPFHYPRTRIHILLRIAHLLDSVRFSPCFIEHFINLFLTR